MKNRKKLIGAIVVIVLLFGILSFYSIDNYIYEKDFNKKYKPEDVEIMIKSEIKHKTLEREGYNVHYFVSGNDNKETIVFLHPAFGDHSCFDKQIDYFSPNFRVITVDMLGHGLTGVGKSKDDITHTHQYINEIMDVEGIENAHIVGVSLGSLLAQDFAIKYQDKVLSLSSLGGYNINREQNEIEKSQRKTFFKFLFKFIFSMDSFRRDIAITAVENELEQRRFFESAKHFTRKSVIVMSESSKLPQQRQDFKRTHPLLILVGDKDNDLAIRKAIEWHKEEPESQFYKIDEAGHCSNMDNDKMFNEKLMAFLKSGK